MTELTSNDTVTQDIIESGCVSWEDLVRSVRNFKYGRNADRSDFNSVWYNRKGTCSSKHAFLKEIADKNELEGIELILGVYLMTAQNTPKIAHVLEANSLKGIPEAHCYLKTQTGYLDVTNSKSDYAHFKNDVLSEQVISPEFVVHEKIEFHQEFLNRWLENSGLMISKEALWSIREKCIEAMSEE